MKTAKPRPVVKQSRQLTDDEFADVFAETKVQLTCLELVEKGLVEALWDPRGQVVFRAKPHPFLRGSR